MTASQDDNQNTVSSVRQRGDDGRVRASSSTAHYNVTFDGPQASVTTAEIPVAYGGRSGGAPAPGYGDRAPSSNLPPWRLDRVPEPAHPAVRMLVWILFLVFLILFIGLLAELIHPTWLSFLRNTSGTSSSLGPVGALAGASILY